MKYLLKFFHVKTHKRIILYTKFIPNIIVFIKIEIKLLIYATDFVYVCNIYRFITSILYFTVYWFKISLT